MKRIVKTLLFSSATFFSGVAAMAQQQVAIFSVNDFHGAFVANPVKGILGAPAVWQTLDSLKAVYPCNVTVSAGDNFGGSYFYNATRGQLLPVFFNDLGIRLSAVGNHEFDDGQRSLAAKWKESGMRPQGWDITYVTANVRSVSTGAVPAFAQPSYTVDLTLPDGRPFSVAFVGLTASSTPQQASVRKLAGLSFDGRYDVVLDSVMNLPESASVTNAHLRLLLTHVGSRMEDGKPVWDDKDAAHLQKISSPLWHGILSSHSHEPVCGYINQRQYPIVQGHWHGNYISMLLCTVDNQTLKVTRVEPRLVPVTPKASLASGPKRLESQIDSLLAHTRTAGGTPIGTQLTVALSDLPHDRVSKYQQTRVGALVCEAYAQAFRHAARLSNDVPIIGCSHFGSIRSGFVKGAVSVLDVGEVLPFSNGLKVYHLTGSQLKRLVQFGLHNQRYGWIQTGFLHIEKDGIDSVKKLSYVSPDGKKVVLQDKKKYYLVADEFVTNGGDGYDTSLFPSSQEVKCDAAMPATTDAFINYLKSKESIE